MPAPVKATTFFDREMTRAVFSIRSSFMGPLSNAEFGMGNAEWKTLFDFP
jgi:hypothetical protein